jgi:hypothetical protein
MKWDNIDGDLHDEKKGYRFSCYLDKEDLKNINRISNYFRYDKSRFVRIAIRMATMMIKENGYKI